MYASTSSADKYGAGRTKYLSSYHHGDPSSSSSSSYGILSELSSDRRSRAYNSVPRQTALPSSSSSSSIAGIRGTATASCNRLTDVNGNVRSLSLSKSSCLSPSSYSTSTVSCTSLQSNNSRGNAAALLLGNEKRYDATKKRLDAFYSSRSSPLLNKSYSYKAGNLSYFEKYNKQQQDSPAVCSNDPQPQPQPYNRYAVNMNKSKYGAGSVLQQDNDCRTTTRDNCSSGRSTAAEVAAAARKGVVGIRNIGNTCYMNSVLQCLSNTKGLTDSVLNDAELPDGKLIRVYRDLLSRIWNGNDNPVDTTAFKAAFQRLSPRFAGYEQQDSQEFLRLLLDRLHMDVNRVKVKPRSPAADPDETLKDNALAAHYWQRYLATDNSTVVDLFAGQLKSTLECSVCGHKSITFEVFWDLSLPLQPSATDQNMSLADLLENFTQEEVLDFRERPRCAACKTDRKMYKAYSFQKLPKYLVLHLKRFQGTHSYKKITSLVQFPVASLDMSPYVSSSARGVQPHGARYELYAVSNHSGTPIAGHYTAFCKHPAAGEWNFFNDSSVSRITSTARLISNEAYILFYEATAAN